MSQLDTNTTNLQSILETINALPEAGSGGGGGSVETCTVTAIKEGPGTSAFTEIIVTRYINGQFVASTITDFTYTSSRVGSEYTIGDVVCGSIAYIEVNGSPGGVYAHASATPIKTASSIFQITASAGGTSNFILSM